MKWNQIEQDWINTQSKLLREKQEVLSEAQTLEISKMQSDYHSGIKEITQKWMEEHKTTKTTTLEEALEKWTKEFNTSMSTHSQNQKEAMELYQVKYKELEAHYAGRLQNAL